MISKRFLRYGTLLGVCFFTLWPMGIIDAKPLTTDKHHNDKNELVNFTIHGLDKKTHEAELKNVKSALRNLKQLHLSDSTDEESVISIYQEATKAIEEALKPFGYFHTHIKKRYTLSRHHWSMTFDIKLGKPSHVNHLNIKLVGQGAHDQRFKKLQSHFPLKVGKRFRLGDFNDTNDSMFELAADRGYFSAKMISNNITVNLPKKTVRVDTTFDTGPRSRFGHTTFSKTPLNEKFLRKFLNYRIGQYYNSRRTQNTQNNLNNTNYFSQVIVGPQIDKHSTTTPINIKLKMNKRKQYLFGLGYGTDTGIRGTLGLKYNWLNQWGHYGEINAQGSWVNYSIVAGYHMPWPNPTQDLVSVLAGFGHLNLNAGDSTSQKISLIYRHAIQHWIFSFGINALNERYNIRNLPKTTARMFYGNANASYYSVRNHINPTTGYRILFNFAGTPNALSTTSGFFQTKAGFKWVWMFLKNEQFVTRMTYANTFIPNINNLPLSLQLLAGGANTVRGYSYQSIGPGRLMATGSVELRQRLFSQLYITGFYDYGNVSNTSPFQNMNTSAGTGLVFRSPIGIIETGLAWKIKRGSHSPKFYVSMGPEL